MHKVRAGHTDVEAEGQVVGEVDLGVTVGVELGEDLEAVGSRAGQ